MKFQIRYPTRPILGLRLTRCVELRWRGRLSDDVTHDDFVGRAQGRIGGTRAGRSQRATPGCRSCASAHSSGSKPRRSAASNGRGARRRRTQGTASFACNVMIIFSAGRPLLSLLPLHNPVIWSSLSYYLSIGVIRSLVPYFVQNVIHSPRMLVGCNIICLNTRNCGNILVSENPKKDGIQVHM
jgi:hypothetical protein